VSNDPLGSIQAGIPVVSRCSTSLEAELSANAAHCTRAYDQLLKNFSDILVPINTLTQRPVLVGSSQIVDRENETLQGFEIPIFQTDVALDRLTLIMKMSISGFHAETGHSGPVTRLDIGSLDMIPEFRHPKIQLSVIIHKDGCPHNLKEFLLKGFVLLKRAQIDHRRQIIEMRFLFSVESDNESFRS
jgi:hypothetical protein